MEVIEKIVSNLLGRIDAVDTVLLLIVVYQYWRDERKDKVIVKLTEGQMDDAERQSKMITLLEVLVGRMP